MRAAKSVRAVFRLTIELKRTPHYPRTLSPDAAKVLAYLGRLSNDTEPGVIVGQDCPHGSEICDDGSYQRAIGALHDQSGKWVGLLHLDYEYVREYSPAELSAANQRLMAQWRTGGLVSISWGPANPWGPDPQNAWRDVDKKYPDTNLRALLPGGAKRGQWLASLNRIARALAELRDAGVVVLWRPMQEMNGTVYWWAKKNTGEKHEAYIALWRDMFDYFTSVKGLNNLLWTFAPMVNQAWSSFPYPGGAYVDVVAPTAYSNDVAISSYSDALAYGKPIGVSEYGPNGWGADMGANGSFDDRKYAERLSRDYPRVAFFVAWSSWEGVKMSLADNLFANELMNDPRIITRGKIVWR